MHANHGRQAIIGLVVKSFYDQAKIDPMIGYHFRHIDNFDTHIPKIINFWLIQLVELTAEEKKSLQEEGLPSDIINKHVYLKIKPGQVGRWMTIFKDVLMEKLTDDQKLKEKWERKLEVFEKKFLESKELYC